MRKSEEVLDPGNEMVLKGSFDELMENIWGNQFVYVCSREIVGEWLSIYVIRSHELQKTSTHNDIADQTVLIPQYPQLQFMYQEFGMLTGLTSAISIKIVRWGCTSENAVGQLSTRTISPHFGHQF
jgi:hypothetical protein